jgi:hypothetical protein
VPALSRNFIVSGFVCLLTAFAAMAVLGWREDWTLLRPTVVHLVTVGWLTQLILGVAWWMFPKVSREQPRGPEWMGWVTFITLNIGLVLRTMGEPLVQWHPTQAGPVLFVMSAVFQFVAFVFFTIAIWKRIRVR